MVTLLTLSSGRPRAQVAASGMEKAARVLMPEGNLLAADLLASRLASGHALRIGSDDRRFRADGAGL